MNRKKVTRTQLKKCIKAVCDNEKIRNNFMSKIDDRMDSKYQCTIVDVEQIFMQVTENRTMMFNLLAEIQSLSLATTSTKKSQPKNEENE